MFTIAGGKTSFTQWETDQKLLNEHMQSGDTVVFTSASGKTHNMTAYDLAGETVVDVPNDMLQAAQGIVVTLGQGAEHKGGCRTAFAVVAADMPDGYAYKDNSKAKPNATHYDTRDIRTVTYTFDGNFEGKDAVMFEDYGEDGGRYFVKMADDIPDVNTILTVSIATVDLEEESSHAYRVFEIPQPIDNVIRIAGTSVIYVTEETEYKGVSLPKGLYFYYETNASYTSQCSFEHIASGELKKLDNKFVPPPFFLVTFTEVDYVDDRPVLSSSATADEIIKAYLEGQFPIARFEAMFYYPREILPNESYVDFYDIGYGGHIDMSGDEILYFGSES